MAIRTTLDAVKGLFQDAAPDATDPQITAAITTASLLVDTRLVSALTPASTTLSDDTLLEIEKYLSAHFVALIDTPAARESVTSVAESLQSKVDLGLLFTKYGQQAVMLDATGTLQAMTAVKARPAAPRGQVTASIGWLGTGRL